MAKTFTLTDVKALVKNVQDATLKNTRVLKKRIVKLEKRVKALEGK